MNHEKTFAAIKKLQEVEIELHRLKNALEMANKREWVELTDEEILAHANEQLVPKFFAMGAAWANAKLKEKNT